MRVELSATKLSIPPQCCCCGGDAVDMFVAQATKTKGKRVVTSTTREWRFPACTPCLAHIATHRSAGVYFFLAVVLSLVFAFIATSAIPILIGIGAGAFLFVQTRKGANRQCSAGCPSSGPPIQFLGWQGSVQVFEVLSSSYATHLLGANARKAVNLDHDARMALAQAARQSASTPSPRIQSEPSHTTPEEWLAKIEAQKGPAGRRATLAKALEDLPVASHQLLMLEASRIEVSAVLDKVDGLKTTAAKKRNLEAAISAIEDDPVPDELQAQQLTWLRQALRDLTSGTMGR